MIAAAAAAAADGMIINSGVTLALQVAFKLNTVVNVYNVDEDMAAQINELNPVRWKVNS